MLKKRKRKIGNNDNIDVTLGSDIQIAMSSQ